jgi:hypothetical protein
MPTPFYDSLAAAEYDALTAAQYDPLEAAPPPPGHIVERAVIALAGVAGRIHIVGTARGMMHMNGTSEGIIGS